MKKLFKNQKFKTWFNYSIIFSLLCLFILSIFYSLDKFPIWKDDALKQHYIILYDFNEMIRNFLAHPTNGLDTFSFSIGLGQDIIGQYSYYILGDPIAYLSLLFPMDKLELAYLFLILIRMYLVGISFMIFGNYKKLKQDNILVGSLIYTFSGFVLFAGVRHPYFLNPVILFPLLLIGVDRLFKKNRIDLLTILVFLSLLVNFYFFYMLTFLIGINILLKYIFEYKEKGFKFFLNIIFKVFISYLISTLLASIIFLPTLYTFLNSSRLGISSYSLYNLRYYVKLLNGLISTESARWNVYGVCSIIVLLLPLLFKNIKKHKVVFSYFIVMLVILLSSKLGSFSNGFSFPNNRWIFAFSFILTYIITLFIDFDFKYKKDDLKWMLLSFSFYFILLVLLNIRLSKELIVMLSICLLMLLVIIFNKDIEKHKIKPKYLLIGLIVLNLCSISYFLYGLEGKKYASEFIGYSSAEKNYNSMAGEISKYKDAIDYVKKDDSLYRISKYPCMLDNTSIYFNVKDISSFFSLGSKYEANLAKELENREYKISQYIGGFDDRVKVTTLLGTKYFMVDEINKGTVPYGYELVKKIKDKELGTNTLVYKNKNNLDMALFYDSYILKSEYDKLSYLNREQSLIDNVSIDKKLKGYKIAKGEAKDIEELIDYEIIDDMNILNKKHQIKTIEENQKIELEIDDVENSELYVLIEGLKFRTYTLEELKEITLPEDYSKVQEESFMLDHRRYEPDDTYTVTVSNEYVSKSERTENSKNEPYYFEDGNVLVNLGYLEEYSGKIGIEFSTKGIYSYDDIKIIAVNMDDYDDSIGKLKETKFNIKKFSNHKIVGNITTEKDGILQLSTSYSKGWKVYVDGKKTDVLNVNTTFVGVPLKKGKHKIVFKYETPYLKEGIVCSIIGLISFVILIFSEKKKNKLTN